MTPRFETERLIFRPYEQTDKDRAALIALFTDPLVMKYVGDGVMNEAQAARGFARTFTHVYEPKAFDIWAVVSKEDGAYAGHAEIKPRKGTEDFEIIYVLNQAHWGRGLATEIARALVRYGFEKLKLNRVIATVDADNQASIHVLEKAGMHFDSEDPDDEIGVCLVYAIEKEN